MRDSGPATMTSKRQDYRTPEMVLERVREFARLAGHTGIGLDPCGGSGSIVGAETTWDGSKQCGIATTWGGFGLVFWNPPYSELPAWVEKAAREASARPDFAQVESIGLITSRTDTRWFHEHLAHADALCFWKGRVSFLLPDGTKPEHGSTFPSLLPYFGPNPGLFEHVFRSAGMVVRP